MLSPSFDPQATVPTNNMADDLPAFDESLIEWETLKSKNGASYRVGREKIDGRDHISISAGKKEFRIAVNWPVGDGWLPASPAVVETAAITRYYLMDEGDYSVYKYILQFENTEHYDYYFYDETGDGYQVNCYFNYIHIVQFNSENPTIVSITGS